MLPEIGASELLIIAAVALIVVGPKDLPLLMRRVGQFMGKIRGMAAEFRASFDDMARQSELEELRKEVEAMRRGQLSEMSITDGAMTEAASEIEQSLSDVGVQLHPPMSYQYAQTSEPPQPDVEPPVEPTKPVRKPRAARTKAGIEGDGAARAAPRTGTKSTASTPKTASTRKTTSKPKTAARPRTKKIAE